MKCEYCNIKGYAGIANATVTCPHGIVHALEQRMPLYHAALCSHDDCQTKLEDRSRAIDLLRSALEQCLIYSHFPGEVESTVVDALSKARRLLVGFK